MFPHLSESLPQLATIDEVAPYLRMHPKTLLVKVEKGEIPATRLGRRWLIKVRQLNELLESKAGVAS